MPWTARAEGVKLWATRARVCDCNRLMGLPLPQWVLPVDPGAYESKDAEEAAPRQEHLKGRNAPLACAAAATLTHPAGNAGRAGFQC